MPAVLGTRSPYGYTPSLAPGIAYAVLYGLGTFLHIGLAVRGRYWMAAVTVIPGGLREWFAVWSLFSRSS